MKDIKIKKENDSSDTGKPEFIKRQREIQYKLGRSLSVELKYSNCKEKDCNAFQSLSENKLLII